MTAAQGEALAVIKDKAKELNSKAYVFNEDFSISSRTVTEDGQMITLEDKSGHKDMLFTKMVGVHQAVNMACAFRAVRVLMERDEVISEETLREGWLGLIGPAVLKSSKN